MMGCVTVSFYDPMLPIWEKSHDCQYVMRIPGPPFQLPQFYFSRLSTRHPFRE
jgi:hypothetical protein